jgi:O-antigen ligase
MKSLYLLTFGGAVLWLLALLVKSPREGVLCGLVASSMCPEALPLGLIDGIGLGTQLAFSTLAVFYILFRGRVRWSQVANSYNISLVVFGAIMLVYIFASTAETYGSSKVFLFFAKAVIPTFLISAMGPFDRRELRLGFYAMTGASLLAAVSLLTSGTFGAERATTADINAISTGRAVGYGCVLLLGYCVVRQSDQKMNTLWALAASVVCLVAMVATGSRGPLAALFVALITLVFLAPISFRERLGILARLGGFVGTIILGAIYYGVENILRQVGGLQRIILKLGRLGTGTSDEVRLRRYELAIDEFLQSKGFGIGTGEFFHVYPYREGAPRDYPHNLFLEAAVEQGVFGLLIVIVVLGVVTLRFYAAARENRGNVYLNLSFVLFAYCFANSMVSGDVSMNSTLWISGGILWLTVGAELGRRDGKTSSPSS